jgi:hypothetical protein
MFDLCDHLNIELYSANGIMERLWHYAAKQYPDGDFSPASNEMIAIACAWGQHQRRKRRLASADRLVSSLVLSGWLDEYDEHWNLVPKTHIGDHPVTPYVRGAHLIVHDWMQHADDTVQKLLKRKGLSDILSRHSPDNVQTESGQSPDRNRQPLAPCPPDTATFASLTPQSVSAAAKKGSVVVGDGGFPPGAPPLERRKLRTRTTANGTTNGHHRREALYAIEQILVSCMYPDSAIPPEHRPLGRPDPKICGQILDAAGGDTDNHIAAFLAFAKFKFRNGGPRSEIRSWGWFHDVFSAEVVGHTPKADAG